VPTGSSAIAWRLPAPVFGSWVHAARGGRLAVVVRTGVDDDVAGGAVELGGDGSVVVVLVPPASSSSVHATSRETAVRSNATVGRAGTPPLESKRGPDGEHPGVGHTGGVDLPALVGMMPFAEVLGIELTAATPEEVAGQLAWRPELCTVAGLLHGGALMAVADSLGAVCAFLNLPAGATTSTIESKTNFFRGVREGGVQGTSRPLHIGRTTIVVQTDLVDDRGKRVAQTTQTQAVIASRA
jgi:uncharacterized protein (TIGR00369 family)